MLEIASLGAKVLQVRSVELGMVHNVRIFVRSSFDKPDDIDPHREPPGTLICGEEEIVEQQVVTGIAFSKDEAQISIRRVADKPGVAAAIFGPLADANINVDMIVQNVSADGRPPTSPSRCRPPTTSAPPTCWPRRGRRSATSGSTAPTDVAKVSVIGVGMRSHAGVAATGVQGAGRAAASISAPSPPRRSSSRC